MWVPLVADSARRKEAFTAMHETCTPEDAFLNPCAVAIELRQSANTFAMLLQQLKATGD